MQRLVPITMLAILVVPTILSGQEPASPYATDRSDAVQTLSPDEARGLLEGEGMGLARPAEMNGFPGPKHVLELADSLDLSGEQAARIEAIRKAMKDEAVALGERIVEGERALDHAFASGTPTETEVRARLERLEGLRADLRLAHLRAHLTTTEVLAPHQIHEYIRLRGYDVEVDHGTGEAHVH